MRWSGEVPLQFKGGPRDRWLAQLGVSMERPLQLVRPDITGKPTLLGQADEVIVDISLHAHVLFHGWCELPSLPAEQLYLSPEFSGLVVFRLDLVNRAEFDRQNPVSFRY